ncbi:MAG: DUF4365 domain-containing protein [Candidatus Acidiferrales bacterium]
MPHLTQNDIEAELSYAYLHAVAAAARMGCSVTDRHLDNAGVDASLSAHDQFDADSILTDITLHVQLKATSRPTPIGDGRYSYPLEAKQYTKLRRITTVPYRILVVLFLPEDANEWLQHSQDVLSMKRCAYWVSLRGAPETGNTSSVTVRIPASQVFSPEGLWNLMVRISKQEDLFYES